MQIQAFPHHRTRRYELVRLCDKRVCLVLGAQNRGFSALGLPLCLVGRFAAFHASESSSATTDHSPIVFRSRTPPVPCVCVFQCDASGQVSDNVGWFSQWVTDATQVKTLPSPCEQRNLTRNSLRTEASNRLKLRKLKLEDLVYFWNSHGIL